MSPEKPLVGRLEVTNRDIFFLVRNHSSKPTKNDFSEKNSCSLIAVVATVTLQGFKRSAGLHLRTLHHAINRPCAPCDWHRVWLQVQWTDHLAIDRPSG